jgi:hypothetical protein
MIAERFGTYAFPVWAPEDVLDTAPTGGRLVELARGAFDPAGIGEGSARAYTFGIKRMVVGTSAADLQTQIDAARAIVGSKARLYGRTEDGLVRWILARCLRVSQKTTALHVLHQPLDFEFEVAAPGWNGSHHGSRWTLDGGVALDTGYVLDSGGDTFTLTASPQNLTITRGGNRRQTAVTLTITAGSANITALTLAQYDGATAGPYSLQYTGTILAGKSLVIDCGAHSVYNDGVADWAHLTLTAAHKSADWFGTETPLGGALILKVTRTGGGTGSTVTVTFDEGWQ